MSTVNTSQLPGPLKIANACFVESSSRIRKSGVKLLVVVTNRPVTAGKAAYGGATVALHPFRDTVDEPDGVVLAAIRAAVADVRAHWQTHPNSAVLIHCSAGQNRSAAVVLAVLLSYGVPADTALELVIATRMADQDGPGKPWPGTGWEKFTGENGTRLQSLVLQHFG